MTALAPQASGTAIGIDIGGSGIKGAVVDVATGTLVSPRVRLPTPDVSTPDAVAEVVGEVVAALTGRSSGLELPVGVTVPGVVTRGVVRSAANIDPGWVGTDAAALFAPLSRRPVAVLNDADAAGLAEERYGAAHEVAGVVLVTTLGTGIGSALLHDGRLVPNVELGHLEIDGRVAEQWAGDRARTREELDFPTWAARLSVYYGHVCRLLAPDLIVVGGGVSKHAERFLPLLDPALVTAPLVPAALRNRAGLVGAAAHAAP